MIKPNLLENQKDLKINIFEIAPKLFCNKHNILPFKK
jgi:hypothetical protein